MARSRRRGRARPAGRVRLLRPAATAPPPRAVARRAGRARRGAAPPAARPGRRRRGRSELVRARIRAHAAKLGLTHLAETVETALARAEAEQLGYLQLLDLVL